MALLRSFVLAVASAALLISSASASSVIFNQSSDYSIEVSLTGWSNYDTDGGCVTCPYTCVPRTTGPDGETLNLSNTTLMASLPSIYSQDVMNGCCYASSSDSTTTPDCSTEASPASAEACGFMYGPTLKWRINDATDVPDDPVRAILFASIDCENFWAVGQNPVKYTSNTKSVSGSKQINGGCYGDSDGVPMVLAGCLTSKLTYSKGKTYAWDQLANKCEGLAGTCVITNGLWGEQLKCCTSRTSLTADWDLKYKVYVAATKSSIHLSGPAIVGIVFGGVALMMCLVHYGAKARERARQTAFMREQEATDDYEEIMTPLVGADGERKPMPLQRPIGPASLEVSLHEGDQIFRKAEPEVLYEGDMY